MEKLADKLKKQMDLENLSLRAAAKQIGVSHSTIDRVIAGRTVEIDTLIKISNFLQTPVEDLLVESQETSTRIDRITQLFSVEPELADVLDKIAKALKSGHVDKKIISEISAFAAFRLVQYEDQTKSE